VIALEQLTRLRIQTEVLAPRIQTVNSRKQRRAKIDGVLVCGKFWRDVGLDPKHRLIAVGTGQVRERAFHAVEQPACALQRDHRILEGGIVRVISDREHLIPVLFDASKECRQIVAMTNAVEGRKVIRQIARLCEWIFWAHRHFGGC
jgi:hypothetical protein